MKKIEKYCAACWLCLFAGYQILTFTLLYGLYDFCVGNLTSFWLGHIVTSLVLIIDGLILYHILNQQTSDILYRLLLFVTGILGFIVRFLLRIVTVWIPLWAAIVIYTLAGIPFVVFMILTLAGIEYSSH